MKRSEPGREKNTIWNGMTRKDRVCLRKQEWFGGTERSVEKGGGYFRLCVGGPLRPPRFICWNLTSHVMVFGGGDFGRWLSHKDRTLMTGTDALKKETPESSLPASTRGGHWGDGHLWTKKPVLTKSQICQHLDHGLPNLQNKEINICCLSHPLYDIFVMQPKRAKRGWSESWGNTGWCWVVEGLHSILRSLDFILWTVEGLIILGRWLAYFRESILMATFWGNENE